MKIKIIISALAAIILLGFFMIQPMLRSYGGSSPAVVLIPDNSTEQQIADSLMSATRSEAYTQGVIRAWKLLGGDPLTANGRYVISPGTPAYKLARRLQKGRQTPVKLTFNNIRTLSQLADRVGALMEFTPSDFLASCDSVLPTHGFPSKSSYPAAFIPDTYEFYWTTGPDQVVERLAAEHSRFWTDERKRKAEKLGLTPIQVATLASIVEEETADPAERPTVARLYLNRLHKGMKLQADPTVKFAIGDFSLRRIYERHLRYPSPFNTYLHEGLPPGPIRIPERATLQAVLDAPEHDYLYMCARPDFSGRHNFARDYATHERNAAAYRKALDTKNIK